MFQYTCKVHGSQVEEYFKMVDSYFVLEGAEKGLLDKWYKKLIIDHLTNDVNKIIAKHLFDKEGHHTLKSEHYTVCKNLYLRMYDVYPFAKEMLDLICLICDKEVVAHKRLEKHMFVMRKEFNNIFEGKDIKDLSDEGFLNLLSELEDEHRPLA